MDGNIQVGVEAILKDTKKSLAPWITAQGVILALIIKEALENIYSNLASGFHSISSFNYEQFLTFLTFTILLGRFYGGSYRFIQKGEAFSNVFIDLKNLVGSTALFVAFFFMSKSILDIHQFIFWCLWLHIFDLSWFVVALIVNALAIQALKEYVDLERSAKELRATSAFFLLLSAATVGVLYYRWGDSIRSLHFLIIISAFDLVVFYRFYFHGDYNFIWSYVLKRRRGFSEVAPITLEALPIGSPNASDDPLTT